MRTKNDPTTYVCNMSASDWQLYSDMPGASRAARAISKSVTSHVRRALAKLEKNPQLSEKKLAIEVQAKVRKVMDTYAEFGARDSEPDGTLCDVLEGAFGLDQYSVER